MPGKSFIRRFRCLLLPWMKVANRKNRIVPGEAVMQRNYLYDNTKFFMVFLVVFGYLLEPLAEQGGWSGRCP